MIIKQLIGFVLLIIFTRYVISYTNFEFEIPFFIRTKPDDEVAGGLSDNGDVGSSETSVQTTADISNLHKVVNPDDLIEKTEEGGENGLDSDSDSDTGGTNEVPEDTSAPAFLSIDELKAQGFYLSDGVYEKPELQSAQKYEYAFAKIIPDYSGTPKSRIVSTASGNFNAIEPAMDFLLIRNEDNLVLCDNSGKVIAENLEFQIVRGRDENNAAVLLNNRSEQNGGETIEVSRYFVYDKSMKSFIQSAYNPVYGDRGVPFMYPSYYGADGVNGLSRFENNGKWGYYAYGTDIPAIAPAYDMAYNFSENVGVAYKLDQKGSWQNYYTVKTLYFLDEQGGVLNSGYYAPDEVAADHLGFFYFEKGLTRVYRREFDSQGRVTVEKDVLVDKNGVEFYIPEDYTIKAYSNGAILLEKDGFYGFMNYNGDWIAQPIFTYAQPFYEGVAVIGFADGKKALIDTNGNLIVKFQYDHISNCSGGSIALYEANKGWTVLAKMRKDK